MNIDIENKKHIKETYIDKSINLLKICIGILIFSLFSYLLALFLYQAFDFGLIFESISLAFIIIAYSEINKNNIKIAKRNVIISMIPIGFLIIYDFINLLANIQEVLAEVLRYYTTLDQYFYFLAPYLFDITLILSIILLYKTYLSLCKADGSSMEENYTDSFYDKL